MDQIFPRHATPRAEDLSMLNLGLQCLQILEHVRWTTDFVTHPSRLLYVKDLQSKH